jgi:triosephosphate isomerase
MKRKYIIGNWKSNKNLQETGFWFENFSELLLENKQKKLEDIEIVLCPPYVLLPEVKKLVTQYNLPIKLGGQNISPFPNGAYTGEVSASQIKEWVEYVIIGHSERRTNFHEDGKTLFAKVKRANEEGLKAIYCIQDQNTEIPKRVDIVAYEPVWAIGSGRTDTPQSAEKVAQTVKSKNRDALVIYGGSVRGDNVKGFLSCKNIDGVLPGGASLDPLSFWEIIVNAATV